MRVFDFIYLNYLLINSQEKGKKFVGRLAQAIVYGVRIGTFPLLMGALFASKSSFESYWQKREMKNAAINGGIKF